MTLNPTEGVTTLRWTVERDASATTISLSGELDVAAAPDAVNRLKQLVPPTGGSLVIDLAGINFMDSSGLRVLLDQRQAAAEGGVNLFLARLSLPVRRLLDVAGLSHWFEYAEGEPPKLAYCPICEGELHIDVTRCPHCGSVL
ncbi:MAG: anti-sigma factor antagonist [Actinomycetota bacterium]